MSVNRGVGTQSMTRMSVESARYCTALQNKNCALLSRPSRLFFTCFLVCYRSAATLGMLYLAFVAGRSGLAVAWSEGRRPLGAVLHSSNEPSELSQ